MVSITVVTVEVGERMLTLNFINNYNELSKHVLIEYKNLAVGVWVTNGIV